MIVELPQVQFSMYNSGRIFLRPLREAGIIATLFVFVAMILLYKLLAGSQSGDWSGYEAMYSDQGGWLFEQKRDLGFVWLIAESRRFLGPDGYVKFRIILFSAILLFEIWLVNSMPVQKQIRSLSSLLTSLIVVCAFSLKGLVQIREGIAFVVLLIPVIPMFAKSRAGFVSSGLSVLVAVGFHAGSAFMIPAWIAAAGLIILPDRILTRETYKQAFLVAGVGTGLMLSLLFSQNSESIRSLLQDYGVDESAKVESSFWKTLYWVFNGVIVFTIRHATLKSIEYSNKFAYSYGLSIASLVLPLLYTSCFTMVAFNFPTPALTAMMIRLLYTSMEICLIIIGLRGQGTVVTFGLAVVMLIERLRLVVGPIFMSS